MSLDVYLTIPEPRPASPREAIFVRREGATIEITREEWDRLMPDRAPVTATVDEAASDRTVVFTANITHNLSGMASKADLYRALWRPEDLGITKAEQLIQPLATGLVQLYGNPCWFKKFDSPNGWGTFDTLLSFVERYLTACQVYPSADVTVSR